MFPILAEGAFYTQPDIATVTVTKNPFSSIASLFRYARTNGRNMVCAKETGIKEFITSPVVIYDSSNRESAELYFPTAVDYWVCMTWSLISIVGKRANSFHLKYEDLLWDPEEKISVIANQLQLVRHSQDFVVPQKRMRNLPGRRLDWTNIQTTTNQIFDREKFWQHRYMEEFSHNDRDFIISRLPAELLTRTGYSDLLMDLVDL